MGVSTGARGMGAQEAQRLYQVRGPALRSPFSMSVACLRICAPLFWYAQIHLSPSSASAQYL